MATHSFELHAEKRHSLGKAAVRRIRRLEDKLPAIIYGGGHEPEPLSLSHNKVQKALENEAFYSHILTINIDGKKEKAVLRALQRHPYKPKIMHMDFQRISETEKLTMHIPLHFSGEELAPGVKEEGGIVAHLLSSVEVICLPKHLPEFLEVDISALALNASLHLSDIKLPQGVELVELSHGHDNDLPVVSIHLPRAALVEEETPVEVPPAEVPTVGETEAAEKPEEE